MKYLLDTCVISEIIKAVPNDRVLQWLNAQDELRLYLSVLTIGELQKGISHLDESKRKNVLQSWVDNDLCERFQGRVLPIGVEEALTWGRLQGEATRQGVTLPVIDALIAATAITHNLVIVTRNIQDLARCPIQTLNPWQDSD